MYDILWFISERENPSGKEHRGRSFIALTWNTRCALLKVHVLSTRNESIVLWCLLFLLSCSSCALISLRHCLVRLPSSAALLHSFAVFFFCVVFEVLLGNVLFRFDRLNIIKTCIEIAISWITPFQFDVFSKFGESGSDGSQITLTQSDKWLRQAKVIDGWNVTTTDTAIAFRKISRGSIWLSYASWRQFLQELSDRADLNMMEVG